MSIFNLITSFALKIIFIDLKIGNKLKYSIRVKEDYTNPD